MNAIIVLKVDSWLFYSASKAQSSLGVEDVIECDLKGVVVLQLIPYFLDPHQLLLIIPPADDIYSFWNSSFFFPS